MLKNEVKRVGAFTPIPKHLRKAAHRTCCQICGSHYGYMKSYEDGKQMIVREAIHHHLSRRWCMEHFIDPHQLANLISICGRCHGKIKVLEDRLYQGDAFAFMRGLRVMNYPVEKLIQFANKFGMHEFEGFTQ